MLEQQTVLVAVGQQVQGIAHPPEVLLTALELLVFVVVEKTAFDQGPHGADPEMALGHPADGLDIAQATGALLDVGFEIATAVVEFRMACDLLFEFCREVLLARPDVVGAGGLGQTVEQRTVACQQA